jgi:hypothetical protein
MMSKTFRVGRHSGSYITVFKREEEEICLDLNYFENNRSLEEAKELLRVLQEAVSFADAEDRRHFLGDE